MCVQLKSIKIGKVKMNKNERRNIKIYYYNWNFNAPFLVIDKSVEYSFHEQCYYSIENN